jgi:hypothetical protein
MVTNPTQQRRQQFVEIQVPFYNYTMHKVQNNTKLSDVEFEKYIVRHWKNNNDTEVQSLSSLKVDLAPNEVF